MYFKERFMYTLTSLTTSCVTGEALGAIGSPEVLDILKTYSKDSVVEVLSLPLCCCEVLRCIDNHYTLFWNYLYNIYLSETLVISKEGEAK